MKKIAFLTYRDIQLDFGDYNIPTGITDWTEVSDEEYWKIIKAAQRYYDPRGRGKIVVVEQPKPAPTTEAILEFVRREEEKEAEQKRAEAERRRTAMTAKEKKAAEKEKKLLASLIEKHGIPEVK